jgi:hypothetical protein
MVVSAKNVILNTTLDMRAGMDTLKLYLPEKYLKNDHDTLYITIGTVLGNNQIFSKEIKNATNPIEITLKNNIVNGYTGDVCLSFNTLEGFKFFFTVKSEGSSSSKTYNSKSFYPSETIFINKIPNIEITEVEVDEIVGNNKLDAKTVINIEELKKNMFGSSEGKFENLHNFDPSDMNDFTIDNPVEGTFETAVEYLAWSGILNAENDGMWSRWLYDAKMMNASIRYKGDKHKADYSNYERIKLRDYLVYNLTNGYSVEGDNNIEHDILARIVREHDEMKRIVKQLASASNIENTLDKIVSSESE